MVTRVWSLADRLAVGIGLALLILGLILGLSGYAALSSLFENNLKESAESQARQLALFSADAILVYDYAPLERYARALADEPGIISVSILRNDGEVLALAGEQQLTSQLSIIKVEQALSIGNSDIGIVKISIDRQGMESALKNLAIAGLMVLVLLIITLFWVLRKFIDQGLIQPVQQLAKAANPLNTSHCPEPRELPQELERLAQTFRRLCSDIKTHLSERENAEQMVRDATERLTRDQRLATVGQVAAGLAHNLNTPLGSIKGYAQLLSERIDNKQQQQQATLIVEQAEVCASTVRNLLTAVRMPEVEQIEFDLYQQVLGAIELMRPLLRDQLTKVVDPVIPKGECCVALGDPGAVEQILFNLLTNAAQAGATVVEVNIYREINEGWMLTVEDNGPGIKSSMKTSMFDPFVTDKPPGEGTGLGLYMSQKLASGMGASLRLSDKLLKRGACFELRFNNISNLNETDQ